MLTKQSDNLSQLIKTLNSSAELLCSQQQTPCLHATVLTSFRPFSDPISSSKCLQMCGLNVVTSVYSSGTTSSLGNSPSSEASTHSDAKKLPAFCGTARSICLPWSQHPATGPHSDVRLGLENIPFMCLAPIL